MENKKHQKGSTSSFTSELFGTPKSDVLSSIFPPSKGVGQNCASYEVGRSLSQKEPSGNKQGNTVNKDAGSCIYEQQGAGPSYLSSSLYYGGQEIYSRPTTTHQPPSSYPNFKEDGGEDNSSSGASRGNWWQGSLYY